jgi:hypothetical protein
VKYHKKRLKEDIYGWSFQKLTLARLPESIKTSLALHSSGSKRQVVLKAQPADSPVISDVSLTTSINVLKDEWLLGI